MLRVIARIAPDLRETIHVHLVETSDRLRSVQQQTLSDYDGKIAWHSGIDDIPPGERGVLDPLARAFDVSPTDGTTVGTRVPGRTAAATPAPGDQ